MPSPENALGTDIAFKGRRMAQTVGKTPVAKLGALLQEHQEAVILGRELIRLSMYARIANRIRDAVVAEQAAEDRIANHDDSCPTVPNDGKDAPGDRPPCG
jgi:hypothetical protein